MCMWYVECIHVLMHAHIIKKNLWRSEDDCEFGSSLLPLHRVQGSNSGIPDCVASSLLTNHFPSPPFSSRHLFHVPWFYHRDVSSTIHVKFQLPDDIRLLGEDCICMAPKSPFRICLLPEPHRRMTVCKKRLAGSCTQWGVFSPHCTCFPPSRLSCSRTPGWLSPFWLPTPCGESSQSLSSPFLPGGLWKPVLSLQTNQENLVSACVCLEHTFVFDYRGNIRLKKIHQNIKKLNSPHRGKATSGFWWVIQQSFSLEHIIHLLQTIRARLHILLPHPFDLLFTEQNKLTSIITWPHTYENSIRITKSL